MGKNWVTGSDILNTHKQANNPEMWKNAGQTKREKCCQEKSGSPLFFPLLRPTLAPIWLPHWPTWRWTISRMLRLEKCSFGNLEKIWRRWSWRRVKKVKAKSERAKKWQTLKRNFSNWQLTHTQASRMRKALCLCLCLCLCQPYESIRVEWHGWDTGMLPQSHWKWIINACKFIIRAS